MKEGVSIVAKKIFTDDQVEAEIERLLQSDAVKLAKREEYVRNRRKQYMYQLRSYEKRGKQLMAEGVTMKALNILAAGFEPDEAED